MNKLSYNDRVQNEIKHYKQIFKHSLFQEVPPVWTAVETKFSDKIKLSTGVADLPQYIARHVKGRKKIKILSLGAGACGVELLILAPLLKAQGTEMELISVDINDDILGQAKAEADKRGVNFRGLAQDINKLTLEKDTYDVVMAYAALHHFENMERVAREINKSLKPGGVFVTVDIPTRNGYLMWDETKRLVELIWKVLPAKYRWDHTVSKVPILMSSYPDVDYSIGSMECTNSEAIIPALRKHLKEVDYVPALSMARRFFDTKFGPNFDLRKSFDKALFELIMKVDDLLIEGGVLKAETFFGAYAKKSTTLRSSRLRVRRRKG
jgi:2-polyprenyl-3-methyl-5-hydroxy-6-metoxy-1,4-benzoquinol methylase